MVGLDGNSPFPAIVKVGEGDFVFSSDRMSDDYLINIVELIPVFVFFVHVAEQRLEFRAAGNGHVQRFGCVEGFQIKEIIVILVDNIGNYLISKSEQVVHYFQAELPLLVRSTIHTFRILQRLVIVEPIKHGIVFLRVQFHLNWLQRLNIQNIVSIVQRRLFIIERGKPHSLEMTSVLFFPPHHDPHGAPLGNVNWLNDQGDLVNEGDSSCCMIEDLDIPDLFPGHRHVFKNLVQGVGNVFKSSYDDPFVSAVLAVH